MADTFRYLATIETNKNKLNQLIEEASSKYRCAILDASELESTNPLRLALGLNFATFEAEIKLNLKKAIEIA